MAVCSLATAPMVSAAQNYADAELKRAVELGFGAYKTDDPAVTFAEFFKMLDKTVELADKSKLSAWQKLLPEARKATAKMTRFDAMLAIFEAVAVLRGDYNDYNVTNWTSFTDKMAERGIDETPLRVYNEKLFPNAHRKVTEGFSGVGDWEGLDFAWMAYIYSFARKSLISGNTLFDADDEKLAMRPDKQLRYTAALLAALRLLDSQPLKVSERWQTDEDAAILAKAEQRKQTILNSSANVTVKGAKYYVSNDGDDGNDGLSPGKPWRTLGKVNDTPLQSGDGVFFKRGDVWREANIYAQKGVTYTAYGTGAKPAFYKSPENGADSEKWKLLDGTKNVWVFYRDIRDCGMIVYNEIDALGSRIVPAYKNGEAVTVADPNVKFDFRKELKNDLDFYSPIAPISEWGGETNPNAKAFPLYLRCDKGNPGALYASIEFCTAGEGHWLQRHIAFAAEGSTFDNLSLKYGSYHGISATDVNGVTVQNCEVAFIGGSVQDYRSADAGLFEGVSKPNAVYNPTGFGNAVELYGDGCDFHVKNNYIHHVWDTGATNQADIIVGNPTRREEGMIYSGNLFTHCRLGVEVWITADKFIPERYSPATSGSYLKDIQITDNYFLYTGYISSWNNEERHNTALWATMRHDEIGVYDFVIKNNVFYLAKLALTDISPQIFKKAVLSGNTYVQHNNGILTDDNGLEPGAGGKRFNTPFTTSAMIGDKTGKILAPSAVPPGLSAWAKDGVKTAILRGLVTAELQSGYQAVTTRAEFCRAVVNFLEKFYGKPVADILKERGLTAKTFADTQDAAICAAAALGIASATDAGKNTFSPNAALTREMGANMMYGLVKATVAKVEVKDVAWSDAKDITAWAKVGVNAMYGLGIMGSTTANGLTFSPKAAYPHEQCVVNLNKLWDYLKK